MKVYVVQARRSFEDVVVDVTASLEAATTGEGWAADPLEFRLYKRRRWFRHVPHDSLMAHTVTEWELADSVDAHLGAVADGPPSDPPTQRA